MTITAEELRRAVEGLEAVKAGGGLTYQGEFNLELYKLAIQSLQPPADSEELARLRRDAARLDALEAMLDAGSVTIRIEFDGQVFLDPLHGPTQVEDTLRAAIDAQLNKDTQR